MIRLNLGKRFGLQKLLKVNFCFLKKLNLFVLFFSYYFSCEIN